MDSIKHVSFDCWKTILAANPNFSIARTEYLSRKLGYSPEDVSSAIKWAGDFSDRIEQIQFGSFDPMYRLVFALDRLKLSLSESVRIKLLLEIERIALIHPPILIDPKFPEFLSDIRSFGITTNISCNTGSLSGNLLTRIFEYYGLKFNFLIFSDSIGVVKPFQYFFKVVQHQAKCKPKEILHIGDDWIADYSGSQMYGMRSILIEPEKMNFDAITDIIFKKSDHIGI